MTGSQFLASRREPDPRLRSVVNLADLEPIARDRMAPAAYDYVAGGAGDEQTLAENLAAWRKRTLRPRVLVDVSAIDTSTSLLGAGASMPLAIAPMAAHGLADPDGEVATARAAAAAGIPFTLSTMSSRAIEDVAAGAPGGIHWLQLYIQRDRAVARSLVERAAAVGFGAVVLTVDLPVLGVRERDRRNQFTLDVPLGNFRDPRDPAAGSVAGPASGYEELGGQRHVGLVWDDVARIRAWTGLPIVLKGILTAEDARLAVAHGADALVVSNHGGRQLDRVAPALDVLEEIVDAVGGRAEVWIDGGVRRGIDIVIALGLGARAVLIGRPVMWALAAGGEAGVARALAIVREELEVAFALVGARQVPEIVRAHVG